MSVKTPNRDEQDQYVTIGSRRFRRREFLGLLAGTLAAGAMASPTSLMAAADTSGTLKVGSAYNPSSLDPATGGSGADHVYLFTMFDTLVDWTPDTLEARPGLAKSWAFSDDLKTLVLTLEQGVTFHDGTPFNAEAAKYNLDRARSSPRSNIKADLVTVDSVEVTGSHEVTLHLKQPDTALPLILSDRAGMMMSPAAIEKYGKQSDRHPIGTGAMQFVEWADGAYLKTERRRDDYWRGSVELSGINFAIIPNTATRLRSVMAGQSNLAYYLEGRQLPIITRMPSLKPTTSPTVYTYQVYLNYSRGPLKDVRVRQALNYAINRNAFVKATLGGVGEAAYMNLPKAHWAYAPKVAELYPYNPEKARQLLAEAGYPDGIELDMRGYNTQSALQQEEFILSQFDKVGIRGRFTNGTIPQMSAAFFGKQKGDILLSAWTGRPDPSLTYSLMFMEDAYFNAGRVAPPPGFMEALSATRATAGQSDRAEAFARLQYIIMQHGLVVPLAFREGIIASRPRVENVRNNLLGKPKFDGVSLSKG